MKALRIAFISPFFPLKGGIARFSGYVRDSLLRKGYDVLPVPFRALYPDFVTGGGTDGASAFLSKSSLVLFNPFSWPATIRHLGTLKPDLLLVAYWSGLLAPLFYLLRRMTGIRMVVLLHNLSSHDAFFFEPLMRRLLAASVDGVITLSGEVSGGVRALMPEIPLLELFHPIYEPEGELPSGPDARRELALEVHAPVLLFFGYVRRYKGLDLLLEAMPAILKKEPRLRLLVAGQFLEDVGRYRRLIRELGITESVTLYPGYVPGERSALFFAAADAVVLPYRTATQSGVVQLAYGHGLPVIVSPAGALSEMVHHAETGWVARDASPEGFASAVGEFLESRKSPGAVRLAIEQFCRDSSWELFASRAGSFLENVASGL